MTLTPIFQAIKQKLNVINELKLITWYNNQDIDDVIHAEPAAFISFPDELETITLGDDQLQEADLNIEIRLCTKLLTDQTGGIDDSLMAAHEAIAQDIYDFVHKSDLNDTTNTDKPLTGTLTRTGFVLDMTKPGWAITVQRFSGIAYQYPVRDRWRTIPVDIQVTIAE